ncbi:MAG: patatin-like phospholipase family protein [Steroidobacteraceae bacterium]
MARKLTVHGQATARPIILAAVIRAPFLALLAGLSCLAAGSPAFAAEAPRTDPGRPRIGLVLSGGGARGAAHVGVLKALEEMHVPIDAIAGTSMGAVVGGLYASGMSAAQIERELAGVDWEDAFRDRPARDGLSLRRKREDRDFLVQLPLGIRDGRFQLPSGLIQGQKLGQLLRALTVSVATTADFDHLPTPFRAVATDLETGTAVVMGKGDLATALRASVSAPGFFAPVERDGHLLVDGGISNNVPIDVARAMNVDRLIVVDVGYTLAQRDGLGSVTNVANQMLTILIRRESEKQIATLTVDDVLLSPAIRDASSFNFAKLGRLMSAGSAAAAVARQRLLTLSVTAEQYDRYLAGRAHKVEMPVVRNVGTQADSAQYAAAVETLFGDMAGKLLDAPTLSRHISRHYGQGLLESLDYHLEKVDRAQQNNTADLLFSVKPNSWGPNYLRFGLRLQDDFTGNSTFDAAARLLVTDIGGLGAEWIWDAQLGGNPRLGSQLYLPFSVRRRWFVEPSVLFQIRAVPQFQADEQVGELRVRSLSFGGSLGREIGLSGELRGGVKREFGKSRVRLGNTIEPALSFQSSEVFGRYSFDSLDSAAFPRRGAAATFEWRGLVAGSSFDRVSDSVNIDWRVVRSWGKNTAIAWASAGTLLNAENADERSFFPLGGFLNLSGMSADSLIGPHYGIARLLYFRKVGNGGEGFLNVPMYAGISLEVGNTWALRSDMTLGSARKDMSLFFGLDTFLGPAWLAAGYDTAGHHALYLSLGHSF